MPRWTTIGVVKVKVPTARLVVREGRKQMLLAMWT